MWADLAPPVPQPVPRTILFQQKRANRRILNEHMFLDVLREFGEVCCRLSASHPCFYTRYSLDAALLASTYLCNSMNDLEGLAATEMITGY